MPKNKTYKKYEYEQYSEEWEQAADNLARSYCPSIYACKTCGYPVVKGYCCTNCGSTNPSDPNDD